MHYKYKHHLFSRGAKHFNPYAKRLLHHKHHTLTKHRISGGSIATDYALMKLLEGFNPMGTHHKKSHHRGGAITHHTSKPQRRTTHKALHFTR
jgi:hypothetical protein